MFAILSSKSRLWIRMTCLVFGASSCYSFLCAILDDYTFKFHVVDNLRIFASPKKTLVEIFLSSEFLISQLAI